MEELFLYVFALACFLLAAFGVVLATNVGGWAARTAERNREREKDPKPLYGIYIRSLADARRYGTVIAITMGSAAVFILVMAAFVA